MSSITNATRSSSFDALLADVAGQVSEEDVRSAQEAARVMSERDTEHQKWRMFAARQDASS